MKRAIKGYCYICQKNGPCFGDAPCKRITGDDRKKAYRSGYFERHKLEITKLAIDRYHSENPNANWHRTAEQKEQDEKLRKKIIDEKKFARERAVLINLKNTRKDGMARMTMTQLKESRRLRDLEFGDRATRKKNKAKAERAALQKPGRAKAEQEAD